MSNLDVPFITVFMAAFNAEKFISASIRSILQQSYSNFELLIVDDGSTDNTIDIIKSINDPRIRLIENNINKGLPYTRNVALKEAKGEYMAILDSDDIAFRKRLEIQLQHFLNRPNLAVLGGCAHIINNSSERTGENLIPICGDSDKLHATLLFHNSFVHSTIMMRLSAFREVGGYPNNPVAQDYSLFSRIALNHTVDNIDEFLGEYRIHGENISIRKRNLLDEQLTSIAKFQLKYLLPNLNNLNVELLLSPVEQSKYTIQEYFNVYSEIIRHNRQKKIYPQNALEQLIFNNWRTIVMEKSGTDTLKSFLKYPIFKFKYTTFKELRKATKQSIKNYLKK